MGTDEETVRNPLHQLLMLDNNLVNHHEHLRPFLLPLHNLPSHLDQPFPTPMPIPLPLPPLYSICTDHQSLRLPPRLSTRDQELKWVNYHRPVESEDKCLREILEQVWGGRTKSNLNSVREMRRIGVRGKRGTMGRESRLNHQ